MSLTMQPGFSSYSVGWAVGASDPEVPALDARGVMELAAALGYPRVQLADNTPLHALDDAARAALRQRAAQLGVAIEVGTRGLTPENVARYIALAQEFASPFLRIVIDAAGHAPAAETVIRMLREFAPTLERAGVILAIENHDRFRSAELARIVEAAASPCVGICLDTANSFGAAEDIQTVVQHLAPHTVNVHLKDVRFRRVPYLQGFTVEGVPLGEGQIPVSWVLAQLQPHGRCRTATLEHWVPPEARLADTVAKERAWCDRSTAVMRRLFPEGFRTPARAG